MSLPCPDPACDLWVLAEATAMPIASDLPNTIGFRDRNAAVVVKRFGEGGR